MLGEVGLGPVLETVEVLHLQRPGEMDQAGVNILNIDNISNCRVFQHSSEVPDSDDELS